MNHRTVAATFVALCLSCLLQPSLKEAEVGAEVAQVLVAPVVAVLQGPALAVPLRVLQWVVLVRRAPLRPARQGPAVKA
jgi:hypothetical protein